ncbi:hypothetical protein ACFFU9_09305 [Mariniflexile ostreae]|uniref:Uncharacterized protein n=1 Tax=Mariniflexile ostreae TaxID=1520892 RepID=A0ABV5FBX1_9FLAO
MNYLNLMLICICSSAFSQNVSLNWSDKIKTNGHEAIAGAYNETYYTRNITKDKNLVFKIFDGQAHFKKEANANFGLGKMEYKYLGNHFLEKKIIHFLAETQRKKNKIYIYAAQTDVNFESVEETLVLNELNYKNLSRDGISFTPDSSKVVVWAELYGKNKNHANTIRYKVFDAQLHNILEDKTVVLTKASKNMHVKSCLLDNYLNLYVISEITKPKKEQKKTEANTYGNVTVFANNGEVKEIAYAFKSKTVNAFFSLTKDNNFLSTGFLSPIIKGFLKSKKGELVSDELFMMKYDCKTLLETENKVISVNDLYPENVIKESEYVPYKVQNVFELKDGTISIVAEQYKSVYHSGHRGAGYFVYFHCDIAVIHLDKNLEVKSLVKMPKYQKDARNPSLMSTSFKDKIYIIYEDKTKNEHINSDKEIKKSTAGFLTRDSDKSLFLITVNNKGEMKKNILFSYDQSNIRPDFSKSAVIKDGEIMLNATDYLGILRINSI